VTNYLFERLPLKWLVVWASRDLRVSEEESVGNPFYRYNLSWEEFESIPDDDPNYLKSISADAQGVRTKGYVVDLVESKKLLDQGYYLIIHSWIWSEFQMRAGAFADSLPVCLYVDYDATIKRLAYRNLVEAREQQLLDAGTLAAFPATPADTDCDQVLTILGALPNQSIYQDLLLRIDSARETRDTYCTVLNSEKISSFQYIVDNSGELRRACRELEAVIISDRYGRLPVEYRQLTEFFEQFHRRAETLKAEHWTGCRPVPMEGR